MKTNSWSSENKDTCLHDGSVGPTNEARVKGKLVFILPCKEEEDVSQSRQEWTKSMALAITSRSSMVVTLEKLWAIFSHGCGKRRRERSGNGFSHHEPKQLRHAD